MPRALAASFSVALLGSLLVGTAGSTSCASTLEWRGERYHDLGGHVSSVVNVGSRLGTGVALPCGEATRGCAAPDPQRLTVHRLEGVEPAIAVAVADGMSVYGVPGYVAADRRHPLHDVLYPERLRKREGRRG